MENYRRGVVMKINDKIYVRGHKGIIKGFTEDHQAIVAFVDMHENNTGNYSVIPLIELEPRQKLKEKNDVS